MSIGLRNRPERPELGEVLAGWKLVRELVDAGGRAQYVAVSAQSTRAAPASSHWHQFATETEPETVLCRRVVVVDDASRGAALVRECTLLERLNGDFIDAAEEVLTHERWRLALFPLVQLCSYAEFVAEGTELEPGSIVTMLVPIAETIALAHANSVAHAGLELGCCGIDERGKPQLSGWHDATDFAGLARVRADLLVANDQRALGQIADALLHRSQQPVDAALQAAVDRLINQVAGADGPQALIEALFRWSPPGPVPAAASTGAQPEAAVVGAQLRQLAALHSYEGDDEPLIDAPPNSGWRDRVLAARVNAGEFAGQVRPRVWLVAAAMGTLMLASGIGLQLIPAGEAAEPVIASATTPPHPVVAEADDDAIEVAGNDAAAAALQQLVSQRDQCLDELDAQCLAQVYSPDGTGIDRDVEAIGAGDAGARQIGEHEWDAAADLGDIELFRARDTSISVSLERVPDLGWRLREVWLEAPTE